jgi:hypothetical protein
VDLLTNRTQLTLLLQHCRGGGKGFCGCCCWSGQELPSRVEGFAHIQILRKDLRGTEKTEAPFGKHTRWLLGFEE